MRKAIPLLLLASPAVHAHDTHNLAASLGHVFTGADHLLVLLAMGFCGMRHGRAGLAACAVFLVALAAGVVLGLSVDGGWLPEFGIWLSLLGLGIVLSLRRGLPAVPLSLLAGVFALAHGWVHGAGGAATADPAQFAVGLLVGAALLMASGAGLAVMLRRSEVLSRRAGLLLVAAALPAVLFG